MTVNYEKYTQSDCIGMVDVFVSLSPARESIVPLLQLWLYY